MINFIRSLSRPWLALAVGLLAVGALLLAVRPTTMAAPSREQPPGDFVLWLAPPETSPALERWPLAAEAHQAGWQARSAAVEERLAALQAQERIVSFEPLTGGVGFIITAPIGLPPEVRRWGDVSRVTSPAEATPEALDTWWRQGLDIATVVRSTPLAGQQVTTLTLNLGLHSHLVSGVTPRPEPIALSLARGGEVIANGMPTPFPDGGGGYLYAVTFYQVSAMADVRGGGGGGSSCYPTIEPGDVLQAVQAGQTSSLTVPLLTALADQETATVYGQTSPSATLEIYFYRYADSSVTYQQAVTATAAGDYQADFAGLTSFAPRDYGHVFYTGEGGNYVYARYNVPFLRAGIESDYSCGVVVPCTTVTATLYGPTAALKDKTLGFASSDGAFRVYFYPSPSVGDTLVVTAAGQVMSITIPSLTIHPDPASDVVGGETLPGAALTVDLYRGLAYGYYPSCPPSGDPDHSLMVTSALTGSLAGVYVADFTGLTGVTAGDYGVVSLTDTTDQQAFRCFAVPFLQARLGDYHLMGQVNGSGPLTVTVWGSSGIPRDVHLAYAYGVGHFSDYDGNSNLQLLAGDYVTVTTQDGTKTGMKISFLTANVDRPNSIVYGQAPPNSSLRVGLSQTGWDLAGGSPPYYPYYDYTIWVTSTANGFYTADLSSLTTMMPGDRGAVFHVNSNDHETYLEFRVPPVSAVRVQSGSNYVAGTLPVESEQVAVTLRDAVGQIKAVDYAWVNYGGSFSAYLYRDGQVAIIEAGDTVEVSTGYMLAPTPAPTPYPASNTAKAAAEDIFITVAVPTLTVQADCVADAIFGQAPSDASLQITWYGGDSWDEGSRTWTVVATTAGNYSLDLSGQVDLERGDRIEVTWTDENNNQVWVIHYPSRIDTELGENSICLFGPAHRPLTLTLQSASGTLLYTDTATFDRSGDACFSLYNWQSGTSFHLEAGQTLIADLADEVMTVTLPHLTARIDSQADTVSGEAPPGARLMVSLYNSYWELVTATVSGDYSADFGGVADVRLNSNAKVVYLHPDGHRITLRYIAPHISVTLGESLIIGIAPGLGTVTVTLRDAGGRLKGSGVDTTVSWSGSSFYVSLTNSQSEPVTVSGGDQVVVMTTGSVMTHSVPVLTAAFAQQTGVLTGVAPVGTWLEVFLRNAYRHIPVGLDGTFTMDWSDLSPSLGEQGYIRLTDDSGNETRLYFTVSYQYDYHFYLPLVSRGM